MFFLHFFTFVLMHFKPGITYRLCYMGKVMFTDIFKVIFHHILTQKLHFIIQYL